VLQYLTYNEATLGAKAKWTLPKGASAQQMVCFGRVDFTPAAGQTKPSLVDGIDISDTKLCLAKTGSEAIAAYLSKQMGNTEPDAILIENQLQAALFAEELQGDNIDFVNKLKLARHQAGFSPITSGKVWTFTDYTALVVGGQLDDEHNKTFKAAYQLFQQNLASVLERLNHLQNQWNTRQHRAAKPTQFALCRLEQVHAVFVSGH
jgi:hypothetical protein